MAYWSRLEAPSVPPRVINHDNIALVHPENTDLGSSGPGASEVKLNRKWHRAPQSPDAAGAKHRRCQVPQAPSAAALFPPGSSWLERAQRGFTSAHPQGCIYTYLFDHPAGEASVKCVHVHVYMYVSCVKRAMHAKDVC